MKWILKVHSLGSGKVPANMLTGWVVAHAVVAIAHPMSGFSGFCPPTENDLSVTTIVLGAAYVGKTEALN